MTFYLQHNVMLGFQFTVIFLKNSLTEQFARNFPLLSPITRSSFELVHSCISMH